jgi:hypothetical protein
MSAADKTKLDGIAAGANAYVHPTGDGNLHVPVTGTNSDGYVLKAGATAGSMAWGQLTAADVGALPSTWVPNFSDINSKPTTLSGYGITDAAPSSHVGATGTAHGVASTSVAGFMSSSDKTKLDGLSNYSHPASGVTSGTYKSVTSYTGNIAKFDGKREFRSDKNLFDYRKYSTRRIFDSTKAI